MQAFHNYTPQCNLYPLNCGFPSKKHIVLSVSWDLVLFSFDSINGCYNFKLGHLIYNYFLSFFFWVRKNIQIFDLLTRKLQLSPWQKIFHSEGLFSIPRLLRWGYAKNKPLRCVCLWRYKCSQSLSDVAGNGGLEGPRTQIFICPRNRQDTFQNIPMEPPN